MNAGFIRIYRRRSLIRMVASIILIGSAVCGDLLPDSADGVRGVVVNAAIVTLLAKPSRLTWSMTQGATPHLEVAGGLMMRHPADYPAFDQLVQAMLGGRVFRATDWPRDHRARSTGWTINGKTWSLSR